MFKVNYVEKNENRILVEEAFSHVANEMKLLGARQRTIDDYSYHFFRMCKENGVTYTEEITRTILLNYLSPEHLKNSTKRIRLKSVRAILNRFYEKEYITLNFWKDIKIANDDDIKVGTTGKELDTLISMLDFSSFVEFRDACVFLIIWETGVRLSTMSQITYSMIDVENQLLNLSGSIMKNRRSLSLPISSKLTDMLENLIEVNKEVCTYNKVENNLLFISSNGNGFITKNYTNTFTKRVAHYKKKFGLKNINPHAIRRGFAKKLLDNGVSVPVISKALNHGDLEVTTKYLHIDNKEVIDALRKI